MAERRLVMRRPGETITREECPDGHETHPDWAVCAECGALLTEVEYAPASHLQGAVQRGDWFRQAWANAARCTIEEAERAYERLGDITTTGGTNPAASRKERRDA